MGIVLTAGHYLLLRANSRVAVNEDIINLSVKGQSKRGPALPTFLCTVQWLSAPRIIFINHLL